MTPSPLINHTFSEQEGYQIMVAIDNDFADSIDLFKTNGTSPPFREHAPALWRSGIGKPFPVGKGDLTDDGVLVDPGNKSAFMRGVHGRTDEPIRKEQVVEWRREFPDDLGRGANPAWVPEPGVIILDIDQHDNKHGAANLAKALNVDSKGLATILGDTLHVSGRSGSKFHGHWYFTVPADFAFSRRFLLGPEGPVAGVEVIGPGRTGFYVVAPGAVHGETGQEYTATIGLDDGRRRTLVPEVLDRDMVRPLPDVLRALVETDEGPRERSRGAGKIHEWLDGLGDADEAPQGDVLAMCDAYLQDPGTYGGTTTHHDAVKRVQLHLVNSRGVGIRTALEQARTWFEGYDPSDYFERALDGVVPPTCSGGTVLTSWDGTPVVRPTTAALAAGRETDASALTGTQQIRDRFPALDIAALVDPGRPPRRWLVEGVVPEGDHVSFVAPGGTGKSLFVLALAVDAALGQTEFIGRRLDLESTARVMYIDMENSEDDLAERFKDLGVTPKNAEAVMSRLVFLHLPNLRGLDTQTGAGDLMSILDAYGIGRGDVLVLDSTQRVTEGPENDADTFRDLYNLTAVELKRRGITVIRTDNTGKDVTAGARGTSAKGDDIGYGWQMCKDPKSDEFWLTQTKHRARGDTGKVRYTRSTIDGVLRFLPLETNRTTKEVEFKSAASRVLKRLFEDGRLEKTTGTITQTALLKAIKKDEGVHYTDERGLRWLAEMVQSGHASVEGGQRRGSRTKYYGWCADYVDPSQFKAEEVPGDTDDAY